MHSGLTKLNDNITQSMDSAFILNMKFPKKLTQRINYQKTSHSHK